MNSSELKPCPQNNIKAKYIYEAFYLSIDVYNWLKEVAKDEGITIYELIRGILDDYKEAVTGIKVPKKRKSHNNNGGKH